jgi:inhibitor of cysteine peptidase
VIRSQRRFLCRSLVVAALLAAFALPAAAVTARTVTVGATANGKSLVLKRGDTLVVRLSANPTTGYDWAIDSRPNSLRLVKRTYLGAPPQRPGQGGTDVFRFSVRSGKGKLKLIYRRAWEKGIPPIQSFALTIRAS